MKTSPAKDRRKSKRLNGRKETILIHPNGIDQICDISMDGLSFCSAHRNFFADQWPVDIIFAGTSLYITGISVRLVCELQDDVRSSRRSPTRKVGVEFLNLDDSDRFLLTQLISFLGDDGSSH